MMESREYVELRSEDVQEILGTPPGWLVRWGTTVVLLGFGMLLAAALFLRYPDVVEAKVVITTSNPPVEVVARADGRIARFFVHDKEKVAENQILAILNNTANYRNVLTLDSLVSHWLHFEGEGFRQLTLPEGLSLGDLETVYADFTSNLDLYKFGKTEKTASTNANIVNIQRQITLLDQSMEYDRKALARVKDLRGPAQELLNNKQKLFDQGIISKEDFEKERRNMAELDRQKDTYEDNIGRKQGEIRALSNGITNASFNRQENDANAGTRLHASLNTLKGSLDKWKQNYLIAAPIAGFVSFNGNFFTAQQYVKSGETLLTVVPPDHTGIIGRLLLPVSGSGKVKEQQKVIVKLDSYPYYEFGTIEGTVESKSQVPKDDHYAILVKFPKVENGFLITQYNKKVPFEQQLQGKAQIVTDDKGLLERIGDQMFSRIH
jgi:multidrug efflux pump subunit AcrA (membrane-fusion protein)